MSNIEEMEKYYRELRGKEIKSYHLPMLIGLMIDQHKDTINHSKRQERKEQEIKSKIDETRQLTNRIFKKERELCIAITNINVKLKDMQEEVKAYKILRQAQKDEDKKEHIRYQTIYRLKKENKKLKGYKRILEELKNNPFEGGDIDILINRLEKKYLKGEKNE